MNDATSDGACRQAGMQAGMMGADNNNVCRLIVMQVDVGKENPVKK